MCTTTKRQLLSRAIKESINSLPTEALQKTFHFEQVKSLKVDGLEIVSVWDENNKELDESMWENGQNGCFSGTGQLGVEISCGNEIGTQIDPIQFAGDFKIDGYQNMEFAVKITSLKIK